MLFHPIRSEAEYQAAHDRVDLLSESPVGSDEEKELESLLAEIRNFELEHYPIAVPERGSTDLKRFRLYTTIGEKKVKVLPVRALPYLPWSMSPFDVATIMARKGDPDTSPEFYRIASYRHEVSHFVRVTLDVWEEIYATFLSRSNDLQRSIVGLDKQYQIWEEEAPLLLPPSVFLIVDDFIAEFSEKRDDWGPEFTDPVSALQSLYSKPITESQAAAIFEGFEFPSIQITSGITRLPNKIRTDPELRATVTKWAIDYLGKWRDAGYNPTKQDVALYVESKLSNSAQTGAMGKILDRAYIERHFLTGITGNRRGHKSSKPKIPTNLRAQLPNFK